jgi:hypothetical protein
MIPGGTLFLMVLCKEIMAPRRRWHPNPQKSGFLALPVSGHFKDIIILKILREDNPGLSGWLWCNQKSPYKRIAGLSSQLSGKP